MSTFLQQNPEYLEPKAPFNCNSTDHDDDDDDDDDDVDDLSDTEMTALEIQIRLDHVSDVVTKLMHLARVIRVSGVRSRSIKAEGYTPTDELEREELRAFQEAFLPKVLKHRFGLTEPLLSRFCHAILSRRRRFMYQAKHQKRLAYDGSHELVSTVLPQVHLPPLKLQLAALDTPEREIPDPTLPWDRIRSEVTAYTQATTLRQNALKRVAPSTMVASTARLLDTDATLPPPPACLDRATCFECPYCCLLVDQHKRAPLAWQKHVIHDLQPFVCIEPECKDPYIVLETWTDWIEHHKWAHAMQWWCVDGVHPPEVFDRSEAYSEHLSHCMSSLTTRDVEKRIAIGGGPSQEPMKCCPFCDFQSRSDSTARSPGEIDQLTKAKISQRQLESHIFDHLLGMFVLALSDRRDLADILSQVESSAADSNAAAIEDRSTVMGWAEDLIEGVHSDNSTLEFSFHLHDWAEDAPVDDPISTSWDFLRDARHLAIGNTGPDHRPENDKILQNFARTQGRKQIVDPDLMTPKSALPLFSNGAIVNDHSTAGPTRYLVPYHLGALSGYYCQVSLETLLDPGSGNEEELSVPDPESPYQCLLCNRVQPSIYAIRIHIQSHVKAYGCTVDACYECFHTVDDWALHESLHDDQTDSYRCDGDHATAQGETCLGFWTVSEEAYRRHLQGSVAGVYDADYMVRRHLVSAKREGGLWCGFCNRVVHPDHQGRELSIARREHVIKHYQLLASVLDWVELSGAGLTKEKLHNKIQRFSQDDIRPQLDMGQQMEVEHPQIQQHFIACIQSLGLIGGWQEKVTIPERARQVRQLIDSLVLLRPFVQIVRAIEVALLFERGVFSQSISKEDYLQECAKKLARIRDQATSQSSQDEPLCLFCPILHCRPKHHGFDKFGNLLNHVHAHHESWAEEHFDWEHAGLAIKEAMQTRKSEGWNPGQDLGPFEHFSNHKLSELFGDWKLLHTQRRLIQREWYYLSNEDRLQWGWIEQAWRAGIFSEDTVLTKLSDEDNRQINLRAAEIAKETSEKQMRRIGVWLNPEQRADLQAQGALPTLYYSRMMATREFRKTSAARNEAEGPQMPWGVS